MEQLVQMLKLLAAGLVLSCGSAIADKPINSNCPCWDSEPGLHDAVVTVATETCVESLEVWKEFITPEIKNWYLDANTVPDTSCLGFQVHTNSVNNYYNRCVVTVGTSDDYSHCTWNEFATIYDLSDAEIRSCRHALKNAEDYLSVLAMCE